MDKTLPISQYNELTCDIGVTEYTLSTRMQIICGNTNVNRSERIWCDDFFSRSISLTEIVNRLRLKIAIILTFRIKRSILM